MNITSCENCGVLLDQNHLKFAKDVHSEDGSIDLTKAKWNQAERTYLPYVLCPVCNSPVFKVPTQ